MYARLAPLLLGRYHSFWTPCPQLRCYFTCLTHGISQDLAWASIVAISRNGGGVGYSHLTAAMRCPGVLIQLYSFGLGREHLLLCSPLCVSQWTVLKVKVREIRRQGALCLWRVQFVDLPQKQRTKCCLCFCLDVFGRDDCTRQERTMSRVVRVVTTASEIAELHPKGFE